MSPKADAIPAWLWTPFLLAGVLGFRLPAGAAMIPLILVCAAVSAFGRVQAPRP